MNTKRTLKFETLETRELFDASPIYGPALPEPPVVAEESVATFAPEVVASVELATVPQVEESVVVYEPDANAPLAPADLSIGEYDAKALTLPMSWEGVSGAIAYEVQYSTDGGKTFRVGGYTDSKTTERVAKLVYQDRDYVFRVAALGLDGHSAWTYAEWSYKETLTPSAPTNMVFTGYNPNSGQLAISFDAPDDLSHVSQYRFEYSLDGGKTWRLACNMKPSLTHRVATGVRSGEYWFRARSENLTDGVYSDWLYGVFESGATEVPFQVKF